MCMVTSQLHLQGPCPDQGHLTLTVYAAQTEPCRTNQCNGDNLWIPFVFWHHDTCIACIRCSIGAFLAYTMRLSIKISPQCEQRVPVEVRGGRGRVCYMCVWSCDTVIYYSWTLYLHSLSILHFCTREASILDGWGSDIQTLLLAAYGKSPSLPGSLPRADCHHPNPHPSSTPVTPSLYGRA